MSAAEELTPGQRADLRGSLAVLVSGALVIFLVTLVFTVAGVDGTVTAQVATLLGVLPEAAYLGYRLRSRGRSTSLPAVSRGRITHPGLMVAGLLGVLLFVIESVVGGLVGATTGSAVAVSGGDSRLTLAAMSTGARLITIPALLIAGVLLAKRASYHLTAPRFGWLAAGVGVWWLLRLLVLVLSAGLVGFSDALGSLIVGELVLGVLLLGAAALGMVWGNRTEGVYRATTFFRRLDREQQEAWLARLGDQLASASPPRGAGSGVPAPGTATSPPWPAPPTGAPTSPGPAWPAPPPPGGSPAPTWPAPRTGASAPSGPSVTPVPPAPPWPTGQVPPGGAYYNPVPPGAPPDHRSPS